MNFKQQHFANNVRITFYLALAMRSLIVRHSPTGTPYPFRSPLGLLGVTHVAVGSFLITLSMSTPEKNATEI